MTNSRKLALLLGSLMVMGIGLNGCDEDNWKCEECGTVKGGKVVGNVSRNDLAVGIKPEDVRKSSCTSSDCMTKSECKDGAGYLACRCSQNLEVCHTYEACIGVKNCEYKCGDEHAVRTVPVQAIRYVILRTWIPMVMQMATASRTELSSKVRSDLIPAMQIRMVMVFPMERKT